MPAPVSNTVLSLDFESWCGVDERKSVRAAIAPDTEAAADGMIVGAGSGAVYGIRINCPTMSTIFPCSSSRDNSLLSLSRKGLLMLFGNGLDQGFDYVMDLFLLQFRTHARVTKN